ncbi:MAG: hypothetical protein M1828_000939 [Chrysothrix sp. TS-e1954]|nr:MAG: hypothetical protein M1828_000939 [Chrysothrix sp. TS-e1954]
MSAAASLAKRFTRTCLACSQLTSRSSPRLHRRKLYTASAIFQEEDYALLTSARKQEPVATLTRPLSPSGRVGTHLGEILHTEIIGKRSGDTVRFEKGRQARLSFPTLNQYVALTPRKVTPIYGGEANLIVSLLDIHAEPLAPTELCSTPPFEILEVGTGHGSLTLHLARAIHAANPPGTAAGAVIHTIDISRSHTEHAKEIVNGFARGIYSKDVQFHVLEVPGFLERQYATRQSSDPFLSAAILDTPDSEQHLKRLAPALHADGLLAVYCPNITQIVDCAQVVKRLNLPLTLTQTVELGANASSGKQWEVYHVVPRKQLSNEVAISLSESEDAASPEKSTVEIDTRRRHGRAKPLIFDFKTVCRPKHGMFVHVGGFLGLWRKMPNIPS